MREWIEYLSGGFGIVGIILLFHAVPDMIFNLITTGGIF